MLGTFNITIWGGFSSDVLLNYSLVLWDILASGQKLKDGCGDWRILLNDISSLLFCAIASNNSSVIDSSDFYCLNSVKYSLFSGWHHSHSAIICKVPPYVVDKGLH